jgi:hypothetical protein
VSTAASAMAVMAPTVVAWVANSRSFQIASTSSASGRSAGGQVVGRRRMTEEPPVPIV